jgi:PAS domain S-box-containing protein
VVVVALLNEALNRILAQEKNTRILIESAPNGIVVVDKHGMIKVVNISMEKLFGYERSELIGKSIETLVPVNRRAMHECERQAFQRHPSSRPMGAGRDLRGRRKDGSEFPVEIGLNTVTRNGRNAVLATVIDISERKEAQARQKFLIRELQHRSQNLFAVIQAIGTRSLREGHTPEETKAIFTGRLQALARAHAMLAEAAWMGAPLSDIIKKELEAFSKNVIVSGCDLIVNTVAAQHFALVVHELATNAIKHGSLSAPAGRVLVAGKVHKLDGDAMFFFSWKESGGPKVVRPKSKGFGSSILVDGAKGFGGQVALNFDPDGLSYELQLALTQIEPQGKTSSPSPERIGQLL